MARAVNIPDSKLLEGFEDESVARRVNGLAGVLTVSRSKRHHGNR